MSFKNKQCDEIEKNKKPLFLTGSLVKIIVVSTFELPDKDLNNDELHTSA